MSGAQGAGFSACLFGCDAAGCATYSPSLLSLERERLYGNVRSKRESYAVRGRTHRPAVGGSGGVRTGAYGSTSGAYAGSSGAGVRIGIRRAVAAGNHSPPYVSGAGRDGERQRRGIDALLCPTGRTRRRERTDGSSRQWSQDRRGSLRGRCIYDHRTVRLRTPNATFNRGHRERIAQ